MLRNSLTLSKLVPVSAAILGVAAFAAGYASAGGQKGQPTVTHEMQLAQTESTAPADEWPPAKSTLLMERKLEGIPGFKAQVVFVEGPPGWVGGRHYHTGHLFGYILEGSYVFNFDNLTVRTMKAGEVFYETPKAIMRSRNGSDTEWVKDIVFQILPEDQPGAVSVE